MPNKQEPKKTLKAPLVKKYEGAEKVTYDPTQKGYKKQEVIEGKTYYDKAANPAISGGVPGSKWKESIVNQLQSGVSPEELVAKGHISPSATEEFRQYYKPVYTEEPKTIQKSTDIAPAAGLRSAMRLEPKGTATQPWDIYTVPNLSGQVNKSEQIMVDPITKNVIDQSKYLQTGDFSKSLSGQTLDQYRAANVRSDAQGQTTLPDMVNGVPAVKSTTATITTNPSKQGSVTSSTGGGFKHGGLVSKIKAYQNGGQVNDPNNISNNPMTGKPINQHGRPLYFNESTSEPNKVNTYYDDTNATTKHGFSFGGGGGAGVSMPMFKKGGLVSKVKSYAEGGTTDNSAQVAGLVGAGAGLAGEYGSQAIDRQAMDEQGRYKRQKYSNDPTKGNLAKVYNKGTLSGGMEGAGKGAAMGAAFGPEGAIIGAGVGLLGGAVKGTLKANKDAKAIEAEQWQADQQKMQDAQMLRNASYQNQLSKQMADRSMGYKDGGIVDETAALQKKTVYPAKKPTPKAPLAAKVVSVSVNKKGLEEQKKTLGYKDGGKIEGKGSGTSDSITAKVKPNSFVVPEKNSDKAQEIRDAILPGSSSKKANLNQNGGTKVKLSNGEHLFTPNEVEKIENKLGDKVLDKLAPNSAKAEDISEGEFKEMELAHGGLTPEKARIMLHDKSFTTDKQRRYFGWVAGGKAEGGLMGYNDGGRIPGIPEIKKREPVTTTTTSKTTKRAPKVSPEYLQMINTSLPTNQVEPGVSVNGSLDPSAQIGIDQTTGKKASPLDLSKLGNVAEYAIPLLQAGYGLSQLKKLGKRPIGELDKDYLASIGKAQANVDLSNAQAKYGYTPEEQTLINNQNANLTNMQRSDARNLSGGSSANAYNMERGAINESFGRGLRAAVENRNLMLQKQGIAQDRQAYLDSLIANKANMSRTLFNDKMNAWQQNQQAGAGLLGAGLQNLIGAKRYNDELAAMKETGNIRNSTYDTLGQ